MGEEGRSPKEGQAWQVPVTEKRPDQGEVAGVGQQGPVPKALWPGSEVWGFVFVLSL